jgi:hypothetical protein
MDIEEEPMDRVGIEGGDRTYTLILPDTEFPA